MTVLILLPCSVVLFLRLKLLSFWRNISVKTLGAMFLFTLNISYARVYKLRCCIVTDLSFSESSEKLDEKSLYTKLCALLCNPLMRLINVLLWFIQTKVQSPNWDIKKAFIKSRFCVWGIYGKILASAWIFLLALTNRLITCSLKFNFLSIVTPRIFWEFEFSSMQAGSENFVFMSRLNSKWHFSWLAFRPFSWYHLKSLTDAFYNFVFRSCWLFATL